MLKSVLEADFFIENVERIYIYSTFVEITLKL